MPAGLILLPKIIKRVFIAFFRRGIVGNIADFFQCSCFGLVKPIFVDWKSEFDYDKFSTYKKQTV